MFLCLCLSLAIGDITYTVSKHIALIQYLISNQTILTDKYHQQSNLPVTNGGNHPCIKSAVNSMPLISRHSNVCTSLNLIYKQKKIFIWLIDKIWNIVYIINVMSKKNTAACYLCHSCVCFDYIEIL